MAAVEGLRALISLGVVAMDEREKLAGAGVGGAFAHKVAGLVDEARAGLDPNKRYSEDSRWVGDIELMLSEALAGGLGDLAEDTEMRSLLDELEGFYSEAEEGEAPPEGLVRRYVELTFERRLNSLPT